MDLCETFQKQFASGLVPRHEKLLYEEKFERFTRVEWPPLKWKGCFSLCCHSHYHENTGKLGE
jgi:hypothetical protein